jgi:predicted RNase H-like HicB family nuclease
MQYAYTVIIEKSENNYGAWAPDLPGCVTTGPIIEETLANMREAIGFHLEGMREDGDPIPEPTSLAETVVIEAA